MNDKSARSSRAPRPIAVVLLQIALLGYIAVFFYSNRLALVDSSVLQPLADLGWRGYLALFCLPLVSLLMFIGLCFRWRLARWLAIGLGFWLIGSTIRTFYLFIAAMGQVAGEVSSASGSSVSEDVFTVLVAGVWLYLVAFASNARRFFGLSE